MVKIEANFWLLRDGTWLSHSLQGSTDVCPGPGLDRQLTVHSWKPRVVFSVEKATENWSFQNAKSEPTDEMLTIMLTTVIFSMMCRQRDHANTHANHR